MDRREFIYILGGLASVCGCQDVLSAYGETASQPLGQNVVGMYVHQHWPYNHPYAARTWTVDDYRGYYVGLSAAAASKGSR